MLMVSFRFLCLYNYMRPPRSRAILPLPSLLWVYHSLDRLIVPVRVVAHGMHHALFARQLCFLVEEWLSLFCCYLYAFIMESSKRECVRRRVSFVWIREKERKKRPRIADSVAQQPTNEQILSFTFLYSHLVRLVRRATRASDTQTIFMHESCKLWKETENYNFILIILWDLVRVCAWGACGMEKTRKDRAHWLRRDAILILL